MHSRQRRLNLNDIARSLLLAATLSLAFSAGCHRMGGHSVTVSWNASRPAQGTTVAGYNVYRSTTPGGPYTQVTSRVALTHYEDKRVTSGTTYYYVVTTVDDQGRESKYSEEISATVP